MTETVKEINNRVKIGLYEPSPWTPAFARLEVLLGVDRLWIFQGLFVFILIWLIIGYAAQLLCNVVGFLYPAYASIIAIETPQASDDKKWLTYWVVFSIFTLLEYFTNVIISHIPLYWFFKCLLLVWLMFPTKLNGSIILYDTIILPYFLKAKEAATTALSGQGNKDDKSQ